jgi:hypothetical protein
MTETGYMLLAIGAGTFVASLHKNGGRMWMSILGGAMIGIGAAMI